MSANSYLAPLRCDNIYFKLNILLPTLALVFALFVEYGLGHKPCMLCIYQRIPYFLGALISSTYFLAPAQRNVILNLNMIIYAVGAGLAVYHFGVEQGVITELSSCASHIMADSHSIADIERAIYNTPAKSCKDVDLYLFGASMAFWNIWTGLGLSCYSWLVKRNI